MNVFVTAGAGDGSSRKHNVPVRRDAGGLMTFNACHRAVSAAESKLRGCVVEGQHLLPGAH